MQILSLELDNTKSYAHLTLDFTPGVNAIVGANGAGKSTILEAIGFALFDSLSYVHRDFVHEGASSATVTVTLLSSLDERRYQVVRRCGSSNQYYVYDPDLDGKVCEGKADVLSFLRQHMGVEPGADLSKLFSDAVGVPQGTLTAAFLMTPAQRKGVFNPLLQVDEYRRAFDRLREPLALLHRRQQELDLQIAGLAARLEQLPELEAAVARHAGELTATERELSQVGQALQEAEATRAALDQVRQQVSALQNRATQAEAQHQGFEEQLVAARRALGEAETAQAVIRQHRAGHGDYVAAQVQQKTLESQAAQQQKLRQRHAGADKRISLAQAEGKTVAQTLKEIEVAAAEVARLAPAVEKQTELEDALAAARQAGARRQAAIDALAGLEAELTRLQQRLATLEAQVAQIAPVEQELAAGEATIVTLRQRVQEQRDAGIRCRAEIEASERQHAVLTDAATAQCPVCKRPLTDEHRQELLGQSARRRQELEADSARFQSDLESSEAAIGTNLTQIRQLQTQLRTLPRPEEARALATELDARIAARDAAAAQVDTLADVEEQFRGLQVELAALDDPRRRRDVAAAAARRRPTADAARERVAAQIEALSAEVAALEQELAQFEELDGKLAAAAAALEENRTAYQAVLTNRQQATAVADRAAAVEEITARRNAAAESRRTLQAELEAVQARFDPDAYAQAAGTEQNLRGRQGSLQTQLSMLSESQTRDEEAIAGLRQRQDELEAAEQQRAGLTAEEEVLETLRNLLRQAGPYITKALIGQISEGAVQIFGDIMQDYSRHLTWTEDYGITLNVEGNERQFGQLSGGEQMSAALAVRLALLREMSSIDVAFFDEPTANLDEARREALVRQILEVRGVQQLFVISHDDTFEQATQNLIRVERVDGQSRAYTSE